MSILATINAVEASFHMGPVPVLSAVRAKEVSPGDRVCFLRRPGYVVTEIQVTGSGVRHVHDAGVEDWEARELCLVHKESP